MSEIEKMLGIHENDNVRGSIPFEESEWKCFSGRETRSDWWLSRIPILLASPFLSLLFLSSFSIDDFSIKIALLAFSLLLQLIITIFFAIPYDVRRLHDRNMSGWLVLAGWLLGWTPIVGWAYSVFMFINLGCLDGTVGDNCYGKDPKGRKSLSNEIGFSKSESVEIRLQKLKELVDKEIISREEYDTQRKRILADL
jgi:uncharacterized membrane protein YhaH (DUF805 family)